MDRATQVELVRRILAAHGEQGGRTPAAPAPAAQPVAEYTSAELLARECEVLFREAPILAGLAADAPEPGDYFTLDAAGAPILIVRGDDGALRAFRNACRHRGAPVASGRGQLGQRISCPYHGWSYARTGELAGTGADWAFEGVDRAQRGLHRLPVLEHAGLVWVRPAPGPPIDAAVLGPAAAELAPFGFERYHRFDAAELRHAMNWKMVVDTFLEQYHVPVLHRDSLSAMFLGTVALWDDLGDHGRLAGVRRSILELEAKPESDWGDDPLLPHATLLYCLFPNVVFIYQQDHVQLWQVFPDGAPDAARMQVTIYTPEAPRSEKARRHFEANMKLLIDVTSGEDFDLCERIQRGYQAGPEREVLFGRNEAGLIHYHRTLRERVGPCT